MLVYIVISIIVLGIAFIVFREYKNEKKYQAERYHTPSTEERKAREKKEEDKQTEELQRKKEAAHKEIARREEANKAEEEKKQEAEAQKAEEEKQKRIEEARKNKAEAEQVPLEQKVSVNKNLPTCNYPPFTHVRLIEMGLSDDEAVEFVAELVPQLEEQIKPIRASIEKGDFHQVERYTHGVKGSATNIGTGGISDLLVEWNTYLKSGTDEEVITSYLNYYIEYTGKLKQQYS